MPSKVRAFLSAIKSILSYTKVSQGKKGCQEVFLLISGLFGIISKNMKQLENETRVVFSLPGYCSRQIEDFSLKTGIDPLDIYRGAINLGLKLCELPEGSDIVWKQEDGTEVSLKQIWQDLKRGDEVLSQYGLDPDSLIRPEREVEKLIRAHLQTHPEVQIVTDQEPRVIVRRLIEESAEKIKEYFGDQLPSFQQVLLAKAPESFALYKDPRSDKKIFEESLLLRNGFPAFLTRFTTFLNSIKEGRTKKQDKVALGGFLIDPNYALMFSFPRYSEEILNSNSIFGYIVIHELIHLLTLDNGNLPYLLNEAIADYYAQEITGLCPFGPNQLPIVFWQRVEEIVGSDYARRSIFEQGGYFIIERTAEHEPVSRKCGSNLLNDRMRSKLGKDKKGSYRWDNAMNYLDKESWIKAYWEIIQ